MDGPREFFQGLDLRHCADAGWVSLDRDGIRLAPVRCRAKRRMATAERRASARRADSELAGRARWPTLDWNRSGARQLEGRQADPLRRVCRKDCVVDP